MSAFLLRANPFLRDLVLAGEVCLSAAKTHSYVAFMRMPSLAALLFFEYLEARKLHEALPAAASDTDHTTAGRHTGLGGGEAQGCTQMAWRSARLLGDRILAAGCILVCFTARPCLPRAAVSCATLRVNS